MNWFARQPLIFNAGLVALTVMLLASAFVVLPEMLSWVDLGDVPGLAVGVNAFVLATAAVCYGFWFALRLAPLIVMRLVAVAAGLSWTMFSAMSAVIVAVEPSVQPWNPALALPAVAGLALIVVALWDQFRTARSRG